MTLIAFNKPYLVHCKFTDDAGRPTLASFGLPPRVYVAGRLDHDSEGLLLLTDDGKLNQRITDPRWKAPKTYLAQVEGAITEEALAKLRAGVNLKDGPTLPAGARAVDPPSWLWPRTPPIRVRKTVPDAFLELVIREGRNRQVRRMTASVGLPTLRLVRTAIGRCTLKLGEGPARSSAEGGAQFEVNLAPGAWREVPTSLLAT